jgi:hypothetical protein
MRRHLYALPGLLALWVTAAGCSVSDDDAGRDTATAPDGSGDTGDTSDSGSPADVAMTDGADAEVLDTDAAEGPDCVPQCGPRLCGPEPVCGRSCGVCEEGVCQAGQCVNTGGPSVLDFQSSTARLVEGASVTLTAVVTDPDGDLLGGLLRDAAGVSLAAFRVTSGGVYELVLTWGDFDAHEPLDFEDATERTFTAEFFDSQDNRATEALRLTFDCEGLTACHGSCRDLELEVENCGACGRACGGPRQYYATCEQGRCVQLYGCLEGADDTSCAQYCASLGGTCSDACGTPMLRLRLDSYCGEDVFGGGALCDDATCDWSLSACNPFDGAYPWASCCCAGVDPGP